MKISKVSLTFSMNPKPLFIFMSITSNTIFAAMMSPINIKWIKMLACLSTLSSSNLALESGSIQVMLMLMCRSLERWDGWPSWRIFKDCTCLNLGGNGGSLAFIKMKTRWEEMSGNFVGWPSFRWREQATWSPLISRKKLRWCLKHSSQEGTFLGKKYDEWCTIKFYI